MDGLIASRLAGEFLFGFGALFAIINPYGLAFVFLDKTISLSEHERTRIARRVAIYAFGVLLVSLFIGSQILNLFGITIPATGQLGWAWDAALFYVKGGAAVTSNRYDIFTTVSGIRVASAGSTRWGGTVGVGFEYGFTPNWSVGIEYDRLFMGDANNTFSVANPILAGAANRIGQDVDLVTLRLNYRFGAPVVARY
jgi:MarC family integral membrane protein/Outer membrane protein beta-barrel domain